LPLRTATPGGPSFTHIESREETGAPFVFDQHMETEACVTPASVRIFTGGQNHTISSPQRLPHEHHEETQRLARLYERKHAALEALKKSLLHQAFTGEL